MADQFLSLLDITSRQNTDQAVGLVEEVVTFAPELERVMGRPVPGNFYTARVRTAYTAKAAFRTVNAGLDIGSSKYTQKRFDCFTFDAQLQIDEAEMRIAEQQGDSMASLQADEAAGAVREKAIALGAQFYAGTASDANGHPGLIDFISSTQSVDAAGSGTGACERAWAIWMHPQGVHFIFGGNQGLEISPWTKQQVKDSSSKSFMAYVSNVFGLVGLSCAHVRAVGCVRNIDNTLTNNAEAKPLTDALLATLFSKFPVGIQPNLIFMSRATRAGLQKSRTVTLFGQGTSRPSQSTIAPIPTEYDGVPIVTTDSIPLGNSAST